MQRPIKFRAWNTKDRQMMYFSDARIPSSLPDYIEFDQFTGLCDKNGKEIYERDILSAGADAGIVVIWNNKFASFALAKSGWMHHHFFGEACDPEDCEIVSNIHERGID